MANRTCNVESCDQKAVGRGWCNPHYQSWYQYGDPEAAHRRVPNDCCTIDGCDNSPRSSTADWCAKHYHRWYRHGHPLATRYRRGPQADLTGQRFGSLTVIGYRDGRWDCRCDCGSPTRATTGDLNRGTKITCGNRTAHRRDDVGYGAAHYRVITEHGPASEHRCVDCAGPAYHWSYDHTDPDEHTDERGIAYSLNPDHYQPRCVPCHKTFDLDRINAATIE